MLRRKSPQLVMLVTCGQKVNETLHQAYSNNRSHTATTPPT